jgi:WD40 repeat protein
MRRSAFVMGLLLFSLVDVRYLHAQPGESTLAVKNSVSILAEPLPFKSDSPLSSRTLVSRPTPIRGLLSWTIETRRHRGGLFSVVPSPDARWVATGGLDGIIRIWDASSGKFSRALVAHNSYINDLAWSSDAKYLASGGSYDSTARIWNVESGRLLRTFKHSAYVSRVDWSPDDKRLVVGGGESGHIQFWDTATGSEKGKLEMGRPILSVEWSPDGGKIAVAVREQPAHLVDASTFRVTSSAGEAITNVSGVAWSSDSRFVAVATAKDTIVWDTVDNKLARSLPAASSVAWSPDGKTLATKPPSGSIQLWDASTGNMGEEVPVSAFNLSWSKDGALLVASTPESFSVWDVATKKVRHSIKSSGSSPQMRWLDGKLICSGLGSTAISLFLPSGIHVRDLKGHSGAVLCVALTPNGKVLATGSADKTIKIWEIASGKVLNTMTGHTAAVSAVAWAMNGKTLASGSADATVRVWDARDGSAEQILKEHKQDVHGLAWSLKSLASGGADGQAILWNANSGQKVKALTINAPVTSLAWTPDGKYLATGDSDTRIAVWKVETWTPMAKLERVGSPPGVTALAWSPNRPLLASGRANHTLQLWDVQTGKSVQDLPTMAAVQVVTWTANGNAIVAATADRCIRAWDVATGKPIATMVGDFNRISLVSANGHYRAETDSESELIYVAQTDIGQQTFSPSEFATKFNWKNSTKVNLIAD